MLLIAPAVFVLGVVVQSRPMYIDFEGMVESEEAEARISRYVGIVRQAKLALTVEQDNDPVRDVAASWIEKTEQGELKPLPLQGVGDSLQSGVKGQIYDAGKRLAVRLEGAAKDELAAGTVDRAAKDLVLSALVLQGLRYSDITSVALVSAHQRRVLRTLQDNLARVSPETRQEIADLVVRIKPDPEALERVCRTERRLNALELARDIEIKRASGAPVPDKAAFQKGNLHALENVANHSEQEHARLIGSIVGA